LGDAEERGRERGGRDETDEAEEEGEREKRRGEEGERTKAEATKVHTVTLSKPHWKQLSFEL